MRSSPTLRRLFSGALLAVAAAGCAPERADVVGGPAGSERMAVLASDDTGRYDILVLDTFGNDLQLIDSNLGSAVSITHHPDGFFLVSDGSNIQTVSMDGDVEQFNQEPMPSVVYRMAVGEDGDVTVAEEYDSTELNEDGEIVEHTNTGGQYCWMDAAVSADGETPMMLDIFTSTLALWDGESDQYEVVASNVGQSANVLGQDGSGTYWTTSYDGRLAVANEDGEVEQVGQLSTLGVSAWQVMGLEPASNDSVFALFQGDVGSGIVEITRDGDVRETIEAGTSYWVDLTVF